MGVEGSRSRCERVGAPHPDVVLLEHADRARHVLCGEHVGESARVEVEHFAEQGPGLGHELFQDRRQVFSPAVVVRHPAAATAAATATTGVATAAAAALVIVILVALCMSYRRWLFACDTIPPQVPHKTIVRSQRCCNHQRIFTVALLSSPHRLDVAANLGEHIGNQEKDLVRFTCMNFESNQWATGSFFFCDRSRTQQSMPLPVSVFARSRAIQLPTLVLALVDGVGRIGISQMVWLECECLTADIFA